MGYFESQSYNPRAEEKARVEALRRKREELATRSGITDEEARKKFIAKLKARTSEEEKEAEKRREKWEALGE